MCETDVEIRRERRPGVDVEIAESSGPSERRAFFYRTPVARFSPPILFRLASMAVGSVGNPQSVVLERFKPASASAPRDAAVQGRRLRLYFVSPLWVGALLLLGCASAGSMNSEATIAAATMVLRFFFISIFTASSQ